MIPVAEALDRVLALGAPLAVDDVPLAEATGRVLARTVTARRTQPPFDASAMDGYALRSGDPGPYTVVGTASAGHGWDGTVGPGQAVRIFTGAPVPNGADTVVIQENVARDGDQITLTDSGTGTNIRAAGSDFAMGAPLRPRRLTPADIALLAAMNIDRVPVTRRPDVAIIATGDELVQPGDTPGPDQIIASNSYGLAAMVAEAGATPRLLPIARDTLDSLNHVFDLAQGADLIVTIGGASVGDHDLVGKAAADRGLDRAFYKIAMRPGKPLMAGRMDGAAMLGLPGNPVSAMVCGELFLRPLLDKMLGLPTGPRARTTAVLTAPIAANGPREHYLRSRLDGRRVTPFTSQDSALLSVLSEANCLLVRPSHAPTAQAGEEVDVIPL